MPPLDPTWSALAGALVGGAVGGLVAEMRGWLQSSRDRRKVLNRVLFSQMDVWFKVLRSDPAELGAVLARVVATRFGADVKQVQSFYSGPAFEQLIATLMPDALPADLEKEYAEAVEKLAEVEPLLAHRLSGRPELAKYILTWKPKFRAWMAGLQATEDDRRSAAAAEPVLDRKIRAKVLETLENDILGVAGAIGWLTRMRVKHSMAKTKEEPDEVAESELGGVLDAALAAAAVVPRLAT